MRTFPETVLKLFKGENFDKLVLQMAQIQCYFFNS